MLEDDNETIMMIIQLQKEAIEELEIKVLELTANPCTCR